jgi:hypothetical protein
MQTLKLGRALAANDLPEAATARQQPSPGCCLHCRYSCHRPLGLTGIT